MHSEDESMSYEIKLCCYVLISVEKSVFVKDILRCLNLKHPFIKRRNNAVFMWGNKLEP